MTLIFNSFLIELIKLLYYLILIKAVIIKKY